MRRRITNRILSEICGTGEEHGLRPVRAIDEIGPDQSGGPIASSARRSLRCGEGERDRTVHAWNISWNILVVDF